MIGRETTSGSGPNARSGGTKGDGAGVDRALRVLVIDDEPLIGATLRILLDEHDVTVVTSGAAAREALSTEVAVAYDVILCDLMLDDISGMELARWLERSRPELIEHLVFMTGGAFTDEARDFLATVPTARCLEKPFSSDEILSLLRRF